MESVVNATYEVPFNVLSTFNKVMLYRIKPTQHHQNYIFLEWVTLLEFNKKVVFHEMFSGSAFLLITNVYKICFRYVSHPNLIN